MYVCYGVVSSFVSNLTQFLLLSLQRKKLSSQDNDTKLNKDVDDKLKALKKRNADLTNLTKTLDERCKALKQENSKLVSNSYIVTVTCNVHVLFTIA